MLIAFPGGLLADQQGYIHFRDYGYEFLRQADNFS